MGRSIGKVENRRSKGQDSQGRQGEEANPADSMTERDQVDNRSSGITPQDMQRPMAHTHMWAD